MPLRDLSREPVLRLPTLEELLQRIEDRAAFLCYAAESTSQNPQPPDASGDGSTPEPGSRSWRIRRGNVRRQWNDQVSHLQDGRCRRWDCVLQHVAAAA